MELLPFGDAGILVQFEQRIDPVINDKVLTLAEVIKAHAGSGFSYTIPAFCSLTVIYDPLVLSAPQAKAILSGMIKDLDSHLNNPGRSLWVPVCYETPFALDLDDLERWLDLSFGEIIRLHLTATYRVYMIGFLPGFTYMGTLHPALRCRRKANPRLKVPAQSVGLAGQQTGIYPVESPGGWQIIGRTPLLLFKPQQAQPFLFRPGDQVRFYSISGSEFEQIEKEDQAGIFKLEGYD
ncbi:MAG: 5-oxoprolinase subunit PxpB [Saprospiraceae bacterium]|nr:5-oxoprolinase subunit PxpB [Saprospiraceae bacterium]